MARSLAAPGAGHAACTVDTVCLPGDRTLIVRTVTEADADGLDALFEGLCDDDRYCRFFGLSHPGRKFIEQLTRAEDEGGYRLVAVVSDGHRDRIVAEAGYAPLPGGNGEFALTVAADWRGWLGPYLLEALTAAAAGRRVPRLEADILVTNVRMLALVSSRGYATLNRGSSELRVAIEAAEHIPGLRPRTPPARTALPGHRASQRCSAR